MAAGQEMLEEVRRMMNESGVNLMELSRRSSVGYSTLLRIKSGNANPTIRVLDHILTNMISPTGSGESCEDCAFDGGDCNDGSRVRFCEMAVSAKEGDEACLMHKKDTKADDPA